MIALFVKVYVWKHLPRIVMGTSLTAQLVIPPPAVPIVKVPTPMMLLVITKHVIWAFVGRFIRPITRVFGSEKPVMWLMVTLLSACADHALIISNKVPSPLYSFALMSSTVTS